MAGLDNLKPSSSKPPEEAAVLAMMEGVKKKGEFDYDVRLGVSLNTVTLIVN